MQDKLKAKFREAIVGNVNHDKLTVPYLLKNIDRLLDGAKVVFYEGDIDDWCMTTEKTPGDTHASLVLFNEPLVEEKAEGTEPYYCARCGKDMESSVIHPPNKDTRVFWHKDGTPDNCKPADDLAKAVAKSPFPEAAAMLVAYIDERIASMNLKKQVDDQPVTAEICPGCYSRRFSVARDMKSTRHCKCGMTWLPEVK